MKRTITEIVFDFDRDCGKEGLRFESWGMNFIEFKKLIENIYNLIPKEYQRASTVDIHADNSEYSSLNFEVRYTRQETDEEEKIREDRDKIVQKTQKEMDIATIERLKKKWGV